jgi:hypothetical protein
VLITAGHSHQTLFDVLVGLHVAAAVIGFGAVMISGVYGATAARPGQPNAAEEAARYFRSNNWAELLLLLVPFLGAAALGFRPDGADFGDLWVIAGWVLWVAAAGFLIGVVRPAEQVLRQRPNDAGAGRRLKWGAAACDVSFVIALALMVSQPA